MFGKKHTKRDKSIGRGLGILFGIGSFIAFMHNNKLLSIALAVCSGMCFIAPGYAFESLQILGSMVTCSVTVLMHLLNFVGLVPRAYMAQKK